MLQNRIVISICIYSQESRRECKWMSSHLLKQIFFQYAQLIQCLQGNGCS